MADELKPPDEAQRATFNKLSRLFISSHDFTQALSASTFLLQEVDEAKKYPLAELRRFRCYETTLVVCYARPFSQAKGEVSRLYLPDTGLALSADEKKLHNKIIAHRNTLYAHSDAEFVKLSVQLWHSYFEHNDTEFNFFMPRGEEGMRFSLAEIVDINELTHKLFHAVLRKAQELGKTFKHKFPRFDMRFD